ncbi:MAG: InlB B-repeat-containing protein [Firmicutes bacterium]|nr:InlB B-repeat-containing protein [Bacillota bacterium]
MHRFLKTLCVFSLSIALLFTMTPTVAFSENTVTPQEETTQQSEKKSEPEKSNSDNDGGSDSGSSSDSKDKGNDNDSSGDSGSSESTQSGGDSDADEDSSKDNKSETSGTDSTQEETTAPEETTEATEVLEEEEEEEYPAQTLTANAGGVKVTLKAPKGALPKDSDLKAHQVGQRYIDAVEAQVGELRDAVAIDVTPVNKDGKEVQPKKSVSVTFSGTGFDMEAGDSIVAYRVSDNASSVTNVGGSGSANTQTFSADHFTIYVTGTNPHETHESADEAYVLAYGATLSLTSTGEASRWSNIEGNNDGAWDDTYLENVNQNRTSLVVKNKNQSGGKVTIHIFHHQWTSTGRDNFYVTAESGLKVSFNFMDAGESDFTNIQDSWVASGGNVTDAPSKQAQKTVGTKVYDFTGWCTDQACTQPASLTNITADTQVYGKYVAEEVTVHFNLTDAGASASSVVQTDVIDAGGSVTAPNEPEEKTYDHQKYEFSGWCSDEACTTPVSAGAFTNITSDTEFYGKYTLEPTVTFNFMDAGQSSFVVAKTEQVKTGGSATAPDEPAEKTIDNKKYEFSGWCSDEACTTAADLTNITADTQVYGKYNVEPTVTFNLMDAGESSFVVEDTVQVKAGGTATAPDEPATKQDSEDRWYAFSGWCSDQACETPATLTNITADTQVYGKYTPMNHSVVFNLKDAKASDFAAIHTSIVPSGEPVTDAPVEPAEKMVDNILYAFSGWCTDDTCETAADLTKITADTQVYGKYEIKKLTVKFMFKDVGASGFTQETEKTVEYGDDITDPPQHADKTEEGVVYKFTDWCTTSGCQTKADLTNIQRNMTVYGMYVPQASLTYHDNTTDAVTLPDPNPVIAGAGTEVTLDTAFREGHALAGWNTRADGAGTMYEPGDRVLLPAEGLNLYAQWSEPEINIIYYRNYDSTDTEIVDTETVPEYDSHNLISTKPTRSQYLFLGWATSRGGTPAYFPEQAIMTEESDIILYAIWGEFDDSYLDTTSLTAYGETVPYDGQEHSLPTKSRAVDGGGTWNCPVEEIDNPDTGHGPCKYAGYVRVGDYTVGTGHHHIYAYVDNITVSGTDAGTYVAPVDAELFTHNSETGGWDSLGWYIPVTNTKLTITPIEVTVSTGPAEKAYDGLPLTAGGTASLKIGDSTVTRTFTHDGSTIELLEGDTLNIRTTGSQTTKGSSTNNYEVAWGNPTEQWGSTFPTSTAKKHNYIIQTGTLGTLTVTANQVKYDKNTVDTVTDMPDNEEVTEMTYKLSGKTPQRDHYEFDYWTIDAEGTSAHYAPGSNYTFSTGTDEVTFYAQWTVDEHDIIFNPNGGTYAGVVIPTVEKHDYGEIFTLVAATREHYQFKGWKANDTAGTVYPAGTQYKVTGDVTFTAQWEIDNFKVTYNPNGGEYKGTTSRTVENHDYGDTITFEAATREHYQFKGWKANDAAGTVYQPGSQYTVTGAVTFTAQWEIDKFQVTFDPNKGEYAGTTDPTVETHNYGDQFTFTAATREHYQFKGWKADDAAGTVYQAGDDYTVTKKVSFTAQWEADKQTITFDPAGGTFDGTTDPTDVEEPYDKTIKIPKGATRDGFIFLGWQATTAPSGKVYQPGDDYEVKGDEVFTALWAEAISITYDPNGGVFRGSTDPTKVDYGAHTGVKLAEAATRDHYQFIEWNTKADGSGESYQPGTEAEFAHGTVLFAVWQRIHRKVTYVPNGGVFRGSTVGTTIDYLDGDTITIAEAPTRKGYTFLYWKGSEYQPGESYTVTEDHVFVAMWEKNDDPDDPDDKDKKDKDEEETIETGDMVHLELMILFLLSAALAGIVLYRRRTQKE